MISAVSTDAILHRCWRKIATALTRHRDLELAGQITHSWDNCPELDKPLVLNVWQPGRGWHEQAIRWRDNPWRIRGSIIEKQARRKPGIKVERHFRSPFRAASSR